jgi:hypothetical protein
MKHQHITPSQVSPQGELAVGAIEIDDRDANDDAERRDSRIILEALRARRAVIGGVAAVPEDQQLTERILDEAKRRSAQISAAQQGKSARSSVAEGSAIPWWLWVGWLVAIGGVVAAFWWLHRPS